MGGARLYNESKKPAERGEEACGTTERSAQSNPKKGKSKKTYFFLVIYSLIRIFAGNNQ